MPKQFYKEIKPKIKEEPKVEPKEDVVVPTEREDIKRHSTKKQIMAAKLEKQPKVRVLLPLEDREKPGVVKVKTDKNGLKVYEYVSGSVFPVILNGYRILIPKGAYLDVPQQVADVLNRSQLQTSSAGNAWLIDRDENVKNALSWQDMIVSDTF